MCFCGAGGALDSSDNLLVFVVVCVCVGCMVDGGHLVLLFRKTILTEKISGLTGGINWFCRIIVPAKLWGGGVGRGGGVEKRKEKKSLDA